MKTRRRLIFLSLIVVACATGVYAYRQYRYPFGPSHCCDKQLSLVLYLYAEKHDGKFPAGEATPEASLSLLHRADPDGADANLLRGKTVPEATVQQLFDRGSLLGPKTCGWHYVEGLTLSDDPRLALFWDKIGLGHNGERLPDGGHTVFFVSGSHEYIPESEWSAFLIQQKKLHAKRSAAAIKGLSNLTARIRLPNGKLVDSYDGHYKLTSDNSTATGPKLLSSSLRWYQLHSWGNNGEPVKRTMRLTLHLGTMRSDPVEVVIEGRTVTPDSIVFEMRR